MRNSAYPLCITTLVLSAFGGFLRWLQNQVSFELETGLAVRGSIWTYAVAGWIVLAAIVLLVQSRRAVNRDRVHRPETFSEAFYPVGGYSGILVLLCGLIMAAGGVVLLLTVPLSESQRLLYQIVGGIGAVYGLAFPFQLQDHSERPRSITVLLSGLPIALFAFWIVVSYKSNIVNPTVTAYAVEIITLCAMCIAFYQTAGFAFDRPKPIKSIFWALFAAFLGAMSVADKHYLGVHIMLLGASLMLMLEAWFIASNVKPMSESQED